MFNSAATIPDHDYCSDCFNGMSHAKCKNIRHEKVKAAIKAGEEGILLAYLFDRLDRIQNEVGFVDAEPLL